MDHRTVGSINVESLLVGSSLVGSSLVGSSSFVRPLQSWVVEELGHRCESLNARILRTPKKEFPFVDEKRVYSIGVGFSKLAGIVEKLRSLST